MSKTCFPASLFDAIMNQNEKYYVEDISKFLDRPTIDFAKQLDQELDGKTGYGLFDLAIKNDYYEVMRIILEDFRMPISRKMLLTATIEGSPKMLKYLLRIKKENICGK